MTIRQPTWLRAVAGLTLAAAFTLTDPGGAQAQGINLAKCEGLWFSTSEDFLSQGPRLPGGPVVSDGDLLTFQVGVGTRLCARNAELMRVFDIERYDHGLDAVEQIQISEGAVFIAFSTEIDSVNGAAQFTAGDLLFGSGAVVPNSALLAKFDLPRSLNLGLDAVHIEGGPREKRELLAKLDGVGVDQFRQNPGLLIEILEGTNTDILFSTEGTPPDVQQPQFLDGDLLSAKLGTILRSNNDLLPGLPSGIPQEGVDYGLDAYTPSFDQIEQVPIELFSIEIQARAGSISDGDVLSVGPGMYLRNIDLIGPLEPRDRDLGLDALADRIGERACLARITTISDIDVLNINQGTGLFDADRPFGDWVRVQGIVPGPNCPEYNTHEFQVRVAVDGGPEVPVLHAAGLNWRRNVAPCISSNDLYTSDPWGGWFPLTQYWRFNECPDDASLAFWNSNSAPGADVAVFRVSMRPLGGGAETFSAPVRIRIDNDQPHDLLAELYNSGETQPFGDQCKIDFGGENIVIDIKGRARDEHFREYELHWTGGDVHTWRGVPVTLARTYDAGRPDLGDMGTEPPAKTDVPLGTLDLTTEYMNATGGLPVIECGYTVRLRAWDRAHLGRFTPSLNAFGHFAGNVADYMQSFCLIP